MKIIVDNHNFSRIEGVTQQVRIYLSYEEKIYLRHKKQWKKNRISLIDPQGMFLTGLVYDIASRFNATIEDNRKWPKISYSDSFHMTETLRDYQIDYIVAGLKANRALIKAPTGSGKTLLIAAMLSIFNCPSIIMVPNKTVLGQLQTELARIVPRYKIAGPGESPELGLMGIARSLYGLPTTELQGRPLLIMDEAHGSAADQAADVILRSHAPYRYGFSATPTGRTDAKDLIVHGLFGDIIETAESRDLAEKGYIAKIDIELHHSNWDGDYPALEELLIVRNEKRNAQIVSITKEFLHRRKTGAVLILVRRTEHGVELGKYLDGHVFVSGNTPTKDRELVRELVKEGKLRVIIASQVFAQGLDMPQVELGINAGGGKAEILTTQRTGRVMRPWQGLAKRWIDFLDSWHPMLERHAKERYRIYRTLGAVKMVGVSPAKEAQLEREAVDNVESSERSI